MTQQSNGMPEPAATQEVHVGRLDGRTAFITGAARGLGRSQAVRLAQEGADIVAVDICAQIDSVPYPMATPEDLQQTVEEVTALGQRIVPFQADVRDREGLQKAFEAGFAELGPIDIVIANAGIAPLGMEIRPNEWEEVIGVNLTGVFNTVEVANPSMVERGKGGAIVMTSSTAGLRGVGGANPGGLGYSASKHGVVGLMRSYANVLGKYSIRVNSVHPCAANTPMIVNDVIRARVEQDPEHLGQVGNALPVEMVEPIDIANAVLWLVSDDARYVTGVALPVDAGFTNKS
jgi:SDR family mycofactocin-dependent oxidoreductase